MKLPRLKKTRKNRRKKKSDKDDSQKKSSNRKESSGGLFSYLFADEDETSPPQEEKKESKKKNSDKKEKTQKKSSKEKESSEGFLSYFFNEEEVAFSFLEKKETPKKQKKKSTSEICENDPYQMQVRVRSLQGSGVGFNKGYSSLDAMLPFYSNGKVLTFADLRGHVFNDGKWATNAGLGVRGMPQTREVIVGANLYYDFRNLHKSYHQIGAGLEALWQWWDIRLNGYFPVSKMKRITEEAKFYKFKGHNALFREKLETSMIGGDIEVGGYAYRSKYLNLHPTAGGYYFAGKEDRKAAGGFFQLKADITRYVTVSGWISYDNLFKTRANGEISINIPFGPKEKLGRWDFSCDKRIAFEKRFVEYVNRFEIMPLAHHKKIAEALDPRTGRPLTFIFVDNKRGSSNGSFENPFKSLTQAQNNSKPGDVIYVFPGDGTSANMDNGIVLQDNQFFIGSGIALPVCTKFGSMIIPAQTCSFPLITNTLLGGSGVVLANNNTVSGFKIIGASFDGIQGIGINSATITHNIIADASDAGIDIFGPGLAGTFNISCNTITASANNTQMLGIYFQPGLLNSSPPPFPVCVTGTSDTVALNLTQNTVSTFKDNAQIKPYCSSNLTLKVDGNSFTILSTTTTNGFFFEQHNFATSQFSFTNNTFTNGSGSSSVASRALVVQGRDQTFAKGTIIGNTFSNSKSGLVIASDTAHYIADIFSNTFTNNIGGGSTGGDFDASIKAGADTGNLCISLQNNIAPQFGFTLRNNDNPPGPASLNVTSFTGNTGPLNTTGTITFDPVCP